VFIGKNMESLLKKIQQFDYVSFDIFDTLVKRDVRYPSDIFAYVQKEYNQRNDTGVTYFKSIRKEAESKVRNQTKRGDVTLDEIYSCIDEYSEFTKKQLKKIEVEMELALCVPNIPIVSIYQEALQAGKKIFIASDMYLPKDVIVKILSKIGVTSYEQLYLSSEKLKTKNSGQLFRLILQENNLQEKQLLHIGDSIVSDYLRAKQAGVCAFWLLRTKRVCRYFDVKKSEIDFVQFINNRLEKTTNDFHWFGFEIFGPILYGFSKWLHQQVKDFSIEKLYFLSRDGYIIKQAYELLFEGKTVSIHYLYSSRRAYIVPTFHKYSTTQKMIRHLYSGGILTLESAFKQLGLEREDYRDVSSEDLSQEFYFVKDLLSNEQMLKILETKYSKIVERSQNEYELLKKYLAQNEFAGKVALVDIGWQGSIQNILNFFFGEQVEMKGYYMGVHSTSKYSQLDMKGYLFDRDKELGNQELIDSFLMVFESLFLGYEGSVKNFEEVDGVVKSIQKKHEYGDSEEFEKIIAVQKGALDFIHEYKDSKIAEFSNAKMKDYFAGMKKFAVKPTKLDVKNFGNLHLLEGAGHRYIANPKSVIHYLRHPKEFVNDFLYSWHLGFFIRLTGVRLPYYQFLKLVKKVVKRVKY
jgi:predicted HAD superfamily hydrolase